jgi:hypothetical protein
MTAMTDPRIPAGAASPPADNPAADNPAADDATAGDLPADGLTVARRMWTLFEAVHVMTYFGPQARQAFEAAGLRGFWRGYFAGRAAPLGAVGAPVVVATFFSFEPSFVARSVPAVWELVSPEQALAARQAGAVAALRDRLGMEPAPASGPDGGAPGGAAPSAELSRAADLLLAAAGDLDGAGRPLGGPNAALPVPAEPLARLWHAATVLREHRGDGHIGALVAADIGGCEALVLRCAVDPAGTDRPRLQAARGWADGDWDAAAGRLAGRGWLDSAGVATAAGRAAHQSVEAATDVAAARPWARLGPDRTAELAGLLAPVARACAADLPYPNPVGVPRPAI